MTRRDELIEQATDYALEHGLIGLSLRPLAAALGTSDRMLIYHFGSKDDLVVAMVEASTRRSVEIIRTVPAATSIRAAVLGLWDTWAGPSLANCQRLYVEAAALGLFGREPYTDAVRDSNAVWMAAVVAHLEASGVATTAAPRLASLIDATFNGLLLDRPLGEESAAREVVEHLAEAVSGVG